MTEAADASPPSPAAASTGLRKLSERVGQWLGLGVQERTNRAMAMLAALGFASTLGVMQIMLPLYSQCPFGPYGHGRCALPGPHTPALRFDPALWSDLSYWRTDAPVAGERLAVVSAATTMIATLALLVMIFILVRQFNWRMALVVVAGACLVGFNVAANYTTGGPVQGFLIYQMATAAVREGHLPPDAYDALIAQITMIGRLGFSAAFAAAFSAITLSLRGRGALSPPALRARWQSIFSIYVIAMLVVAFMTLNSHALLDYAAAPLAGAPPHAAMGDIGDEPAHNRIGSIVATFAAVISTIILVAACGPSFLSIRHDIHIKAEEAAAKSADARAAQDWISENNLDLTPLKTLVTLFATIMPAALPALGDAFTALAAKLG